MEIFIKDPKKMREMFEHCPINYTMNKIGGKWKPVILHRIKVGVNRFGILQRAIPIISKQMLTSQLRELEEDGFIERKIFAEIPPRVEYSISTLGETVFPVLDAIAQWGKARMGED
jgi:DNA-binding HxlR family transcriptional regulator